MLLLFMADGNQKRQQGQHRAYACYSYPAPGLPATAGEEGIGLGIKNAVSMLGATVLWLLTIWIPYLNVGTTISMNTFPLLNSMGMVFIEMVVPTFR